jgi:hypothetical protein
LREQANQPSLPLQQLQQDLAQTLFDQMKYAEDLTALEVQGQTLQVNLGNYNKRIKTIAKLDPNSQLEFLHIFSTHATEKYQPQLESDFLSLQPGLRLPENTIRTIAGISQLEQSKRDRRLNQTIAIAGIGLATSQIACAVILAPPPHPKNSFPFQYQVTVFTTSLVIGLVFAGLLSLFFRRLR